MSVSSLPQYLFGRQWAVTLSETGQPGLKYEGPGKDEKGLRVEFEITKTSQFSSNKAEIKIYNLSGLSRESFQKKGVKLKLEVGYQGLLSAVYFGDVAKSNSMRSGDIITKFECGDAERNILNAHFDKSYPPGTTAVSIFKDLAIALDVDVGTVLGIQNKVYNSGVTCTGAVSTILKRLCEGQGLEASVQNGTLQIIPLSGHNGETAIFLDKTTGLIGVPSKKDSGCEFTALLNPQMLPGTLVQVKSETVQGYFKIKTAKFQGDSHGDKWQVLCEGTRISASQSFPFNSGLNFKTSAGLA